MQTPYHVLQHYVLTIITSSASPYVVQSTIVFCDIHLQSSSYMKKSSEIVSCRPGSFFVKLCSKDEGPKLISSHCRDKQQRHDYQLGNVFLRHKIL